MITSAYRRILASKTDVLIPKGAKYYSYRAPQGYCLIDVVQESNHKGLPVSELGGGTLLMDCNYNAKYVLTAAHLFDGSPKEIQVRVRPFYRNEPHKTYVCNTVAIHPYYEGYPSNYRHDLALIELPENDFVGNAVSIMSIYEGTLSKKSKIMFTGMGVDNSSGVIRDTLFSDTMQVQDVLPHIVSTIPANNKGFTQGFSGGPVYNLSNYSAFCGVISHYLPTSPTQEKQCFFTPASYAFQWADSIIEKE